MLELRGHNTVIGRTRTGKTYRALRILKEQKQGVFFFNTQLNTKSMPPGYIMASASNSFSQIKEALKAGKKINYLPPTHPDRRDLELSLLIDKFFDAGFDEDRNIYLAVDEVHLFSASKPKKQLERIATTGLNAGLNGVWISQRPALIENTLMTQSIGMLIFECNMESQYFDRYKIPYSDMENEIIKNGEYSYCFYDFKKYQVFKGKC